MLPAISDTAFFTLTPFSVLIDRLSKEITAVSRK
jgi:hypothetical protein